VAFNVFNEELKHFVKYWVPVIAYSLLIFYLSSRTTLPSFGGGIENFDKVVHFLEYGVFAAIIFRALTNSPKSCFQKKAFLWSVLFASLYAVSDEFHQFFVPGRSCDFFDWAADTGGAVTGQFIIFIKQLFEEV